MKTNLTGLLKVSAFAIAMLGSTAIVGAIAFPDMAYAKDGNGGGKGNGGGNGGGKGNGGGNGGGKGNGGDKGNSESAGKGKGNSGGNGATKGGGSKSAGKSGRTTSGAKGSKSKSSKGKSFSLKDLFSGKKSKKTQTKTAPAAHTKKPKVQIEETELTESRKKGNKLAAALGVHPSELGALNAANASETALENAAPNSRVGRIANYRDTVLAGESIRAELAEKQELLDEMNPPDRSSEELNDDLEDALANVQEKQDIVDDLEQQLADAGGTDPDIEDALQAANDDLQASKDTADNLNAEKQAALEYEEAVQDVEDLSDAVENQALNERTALEDAANKPVTDEVEAAVKSMLGLDS